MAFSGAHLALAFPFPGLGVPVARSEARRLGDVWRGLVGAWPRWNNNQLHWRSRPGTGSGCGGLSGLGRRGWFRCRNQPCRGLDLDVSVGSLRGQARVDLCNLLDDLVRRFFIDNLRRTRADGLCHKLIEQLVQAGLPAEVLRARAQTIARTPSTHSQLASLVVGYEPVVGLFLFTTADVARYCLPDHPGSPRPHSLSAARSIPVFPLPPTAAEIRRRPQIVQLKPSEDSRDRPLLFHRVSGEMSES